MVNISGAGRYYDYLLLSSEFSSLPTYAPDGSTAYLVDTKILYIFYAGAWYEV